METRGCSLKAQKPGLDPVFNNLHPIGNLAFTSKLTERAVFKQTHNHLSAEKLYPTFQSAYLGNHSTETALLRVKHDILMNRNRQQVTLLILLDLSAAFDMVDHNILLNRLHSNFGISGKVIEWFKSYASNRSLFVSLNGGTSAILTWSTAYLKGLVLVRFCLFCIHANFLTSLRNISQTRMPLLDDTQLYISFKRDDDMDKEAALLTMQKCIDCIKDWMLKDKPKLNDDKTEIILIGTRQQLAKTKLSTCSFGDTQMALSTELRNLGCWFDSQLTMNSHIIKTCKSAFYHLWLWTAVAVFSSPLRHST